jgi:hypothetical protein
MDGYKAYRFYLAIKLHFSSDKFNVFENHGHVKYPKQKFELRNDKYIFEKLARKFATDREYIRFLAANFMYGNSDVVYSGSEANDNYLQYIKRKESITKIFKDDVFTIINVIETEKINCTLNQLPFIISLYLSNRITLETLRIIDDRLQIIYNLKMQNQVLYSMFEDALRVVDKSRGFVKYDSMKTDPIIDNLVEELSALKNESDT